MTENPEPEPDTHPQPDPLYLAQSHFLSLRRTHT